MKNAMSKGATSNISIQSGPAVPARNLGLTYGKAKTFVGTDLFAFFQFGRVRFTKPVV